MTHVTFSTWVYYVFHTCRSHCRQYHRNSEEVTHFDMIGAETPVVITRPYNPYYGQAGYIKREGICNNTDTPQASHKKYCHANSKQFDMVKVIQPKLCCLFLNWKFNIFTLYDPQSSVQSSINFLISQELPRGASFLLVGSHL